MEYGTATKMNYRHMQEHGWISQMQGVRNQKEQVKKNMMPCKSLVKVKLTYGIKS